MEVDPVERFLGGRFLGTAQKWTHKQIGSMGSAANKAQLRYIILIEKTEKVKKKVCGSP